MTETVDEVASLLAGETLDLVLSRADADAFLADCLKGEPDWKDVLRVVPIELDERNVSPN